MNTNIMFMNVSGDFRTYGSNVKLKTEPQGSNFKNLLFTANQKYNRKISSSSSSGINVERIYTLSDDTIDKKESLNSNKLPELFISESFNDSGNLSKGNSVDVQESKDKNEKEELNLDSSMGTDILPQFIINPDFLNQIKFIISGNDSSPKNEMFPGNNSLSSEANNDQIFTFFDESYLSALTQKISDLFNKETKNNPQIENGDATNFNNLMEKIADLIKNQIIQNQTVQTFSTTFFEDLLKKMSEIINNKTQLLSLNPVTNDSLDSLKMYENNIGNNVQQNESDLNNFPKFFAENILKIESALKSKGVNVDELNIKDFKFFNKNNSQLRVGTDPVNVKSDQINISKNIKGFDQFQQAGDLLLEGAEDSASIDSAKDNFMAKISSIMNQKITNTYRHDVSTADKLIDPQRIIDTIVKDVTQTIQNGKTELEVKLIPESLGKLTIKIAMEDGKLNANIEVKNNEVKQIIDNGMVKMREDLNQSGIHFEKINVFISDNNQFENHHDRYFKQNTRFNNAPEDLSISDELEMVRNMGYNTIEYTV